MVKKLMLAVAMVALVAAPSFAAVQNVKVGGDLKTTSVIRNGFSSAGVNSEAKSQNVILSQVGLNVSADLTDNVSTTLRLVNERLWGGYDAGAASSGMDLDTANVTLKEFLYAPLTVTIGRQPLVYGNALVIGDGDSTSNVSNPSDITGGINFDAIKGVFNYDPLVVDVFAAKISEDTNVASNDDDDVDLYGVNSNFKLGGDMNVVLEGYLFAKFDKSQIDGVGGPDMKTQKLYVPGLRASLNPIEGLGIQLEGAYQTGNADADETIHAYALQGKFSLALPVAKDMKMGLNGGYTILSGDKDTTDGKLKAWQTVYEDQWTGRIFDTINSNSNLKVAELGLELVPLQDVTTKLTAYHLSKDKKAAGSNKQIGTEVDLDVTYAYTEDVKIGVSAGIYNPKNSEGENATQVLSSVSVLF